MELDKDTSISDILVNYNMNESTPMNVNAKLKIADKDDVLNVPYQEEIGCFLFVARITRPDKLYADNFLCKYNQCPGNDEWVIVKRILR